VAKNGSINLAKIIDKFDLTLNVAGAVLGGGWVDFNAVAPNLCRYKKVIK